MLVIRDSQIQSFIVSGETDVVATVCEAVISADPDRTSGIRPERLAAMAEIGIKRARQQGFEKPEDIAVFVTLMFVISPKFYRQPAIAAALADETYSLSERLLVLGERVEDAAWADAERAYDADFWFRDEQGDTK